MKEVKSVLRVQTPTKRRLGGATMSRLLLSVDSWQEYKEHRPVSFGQSIHTGQTTLQTNALEVRFLEVWSGLRRHAGERNLSIDRLWSITASMDSAIGQQLLVCTMGTDTDEETTRWSNIESTASLCRLLAETQSATFRQHRTSNPHQANNPTDECSGSSISGGLIMASSARWREESQH